MLAATIRRILEDPERHDVVLTVESPIEFLYDEVAIQNSVVARSQIGRHLPSWPRAVRNGLRRGPTTLLIGESRDNETMAATPGGVSDRSFDLHHPAHHRRARHRVAHGADVPRGNAIPLTPT